MSHPLGDETTLPPENLTLDGGDKGQRLCPALVVIWCRDEPSRVGEVLLLPSRTSGTFGRGDQSNTASRVGLVRQRPGARKRVAENDPTPALNCSRISREQLRIRNDGGDTLEVEAIGRARVLCNGREITRAVVRAGDILELQNEMLFLSEPRPSHMLAMPELAEAHAFGSPDTAGILGESPAAWELRRQIAIVAKLSTHVLILGPSGSGKELVARAVHQLSNRGRRQMVSRNAATIPDGLADAELFGSLRNYPNAGMPERPGLIGEAHGSTLFLDEFAELSVVLQARLLRVLDDGEYQRLGDASSRRAELRLIAATNRPTSLIKEDVLARLLSRIVVPDLNARRADIPLLAAHLLRKHALSAPDVFERYFAEPPSIWRTQNNLAPRVAPTLIEALVTHGYTTHVRELSALLLQAALESTGKYVELTDTVARALKKDPAPGPRESAQEPASSGGMPSSVEEQKRLEILRKHGFRVGDCGHDPAYPGNRQTADFHLRQLICKALAHSNFSVDHAAEILAGDRELIGKVRERIETFLANLSMRRSRLVSEGDTSPDESLAKALADEWRGSVSLVVAVAEALRKNQIRR